MIFNILDNTTELWMTKYIIGEIFSSSGATFYKNPSDQTVYTYVLYVFLVILIHNLRPSLCSGANCVTESRGTHGINIDFHFFQGEFYFSPLISIRIQHFFSFCVNFLTFFNIFLFLCEDFKKSELNLTFL